MSEKEVENLTEYILQHKILSYEDRPQAVSYEKTLFGYKIIIHTFYEKKVFWEDESFVGLTDYLDQVKTFSIN